MSPAFAQEKSVRARLIAREKHARHRPLGVASTRAPRARRQPRQRRARPWSRSTAPLAKPHEAPQLAAVAPVCPGAGRLRRWRSHPPSPADLGRGKLPTVCARKAPQTPPNAGRAWVARRTRRPGLDRRTWARTRAGRGRDRRSRPASAERRPRCAWPRSVDRSGAQRARRALTTATAQR